MEINSQLKKSFLFKGMSFLFLPSISLEFTKSKFGKSLAMIKQEYIAIISFFAALFIILYKDLIVRFMGFDLGILAPLFLISAVIFSEKSKIKITKAHFWYLAFLIISCISGLIALTMGSSPKILFFGLLIYLQFILAFVAGQTVEIQKIIRGLIFLFIAPAIYGLWQFLTGATTVGFSSFEKISGSRAVAWFGTPNVFGVLMAFFAVVAGYQFLKNKKVNDGILLSTALGGLLVSFSRSAWLGYGAVVLLSIIIKNRKYLLWSPAVFLVLFSSKVRNRILSVFNPQYLQDSSLDGRIWAIRNGLYIWTRKPLLGYGPGSYGGEIAEKYASPAYLLGLQNGYTPLYYTDNQWLEILIQTGILGILSFIGFMFSAFWHILRLFKRYQNDIYLVPLAFGIIFVVAGTTGNVLEFGAVSVPVAMVFGSVINEN